VDSEQLVLTTYNWSLITAKPKGFAGGGEEELPLLSKNEDFCPSTSLS